MTSENNAVIAAYKNLDIENMPKETSPEKNTGLLGRKSKGTDSGLDMTNPVVRVAKQFELIRNNRNKINGTDI
tara:strand:- start:3383 stop:3601 length:219 start_codon:yes stop_codon:yes gene_type:complete